MPEAVVLGTAQDGGLPHAGCLCVNCRAARADVMQRRLPASLGLRTGDEWTLIDTTMAFEEQLYRLWSRRPASAYHQSERFQPPKVILHTHAHPGHYAGLWQFDLSVLNARDVLILTPPDMAALLREQQPWIYMIENGHIHVESLIMEHQFSPISGVTVTPISVPHRTETNTDTVCFLINGPERSLLYLPDIDFWDDWDRDIVTEVAAVDIAILDGSFWDAPTSARVPHPMIVESMDRLQQIADAGSTAIVFTHLNHNNPAITPDSVERQELEKRGFAVATEGQVIEL